MSTDTAVSATPVGPDALIRAGRALLAGCRAKRGWAGEAPAPTYFVCATRAAFVANSFQHIPELAELDRVADQE